MTMNDTGEKRRLIDANALMEVLKEKHDWIMQDPEVSPSVKWGEAVCHNRAREAIEKAPTVDAVEVVHGRWEEYQVPHIKCCSKCDWGTGAECNFNYCPNCGAKMDLEV